MSDECVIQLITLTSSPSDVVYSENEIYDVYIRDDDTMLRTELECRVWSAEVVFIGR